MKTKIKLLPIILVWVLVVLVSGCAKKTENGVYMNEMVDFASIQTVAVMPFENLTDTEDAAARVRDVFMNMLLATEAVYVLPTGEVFRGISRVGMQNPVAPSIDEIKSLANILEIDVVVTGVVREYQLVRSGASSANIVSLSLQMIEADTGTIIWSAASTKGGITLTDRMFGGGGIPMNNTTLESIEDLLNKLFM
ncbi:MAG: penicillin-binding protein activator LpoB [Desulfobacterales bacterium SG8_35_2]|nr:MAG: penicillin-binding protein activator LpoB [Desulfobacterales bacterium SG8_35_2]